MINLIEIQKNDYSNRVTLEFDKLLSVLSNPPCVKVIKTDLFQFSRLLI